jgi:hypothetical protein
MTDASIEVDTSALERGIAQIARGCQAGTVPAAVATASRVAGRLRDSLPVRTGALRATVAVSTEQAGASVSYGGSLPYATYIDRRTGATSSATSTAEAEWYAAALLIAEREVRTV